MAQSQISGNSEAQASDIFIDPFVLRNQETLLEYLGKLQEICFTLMINIHATEVEKYQELLKQERENVAGSIKAPIHKVEVPIGCFPEDLKTKWLLPVADLC